MSIITKKLTLLTLNFIVVTLCVECWISVVTNNYDLKRKSQVNSNFEIRNGLLGIKRDVFLVLLGYSSFDCGDNKTRNVEI
jgi:hypothetical protein